MFYSWLGGNDNSLNGASSTYNVLLATRGTSSLEIIVACSYCLVYSHVAVNAYTGRDLDVNCHHKCGQWITIDLNMAHELGGAKIILCPLSKITTLKP